MRLNFTSGSENYVISRDIKRYDTILSANNVIASLIRERTTEPWEYPFTLQNEAENSRNGFR